MKEKMQRRLFIILFLVPTLIAFVLFYVYPLITVFVTTLCKWGLPEPQRAGASAAGRSARELPVYLYRVSVFQDRTGQLAQMGAVRAR